jgi:cytochrome c553
VTAAVFLGLVQETTRRGLAASAGGEEARAPQRLVDTGLYVDGRHDVVDPRNRPFSPQYPLWSDGASKSRWIRLPPGAAIDATNQGLWDFPTGTRFWKEFSFNGRKVETRMLWKASADRWVPASYLWNAEGTDAVLASAEGVPGVVEVSPGRRYNIPSVTDCAACHGTDVMAPLGFNALQLSTDRDPNAIHGEPLRPEMVTLRTLVVERILSPSQTHLLAQPPRIRTSSPQTRAVLGYFAANCGTCHDGSDEIAVTMPSLKHSDLLADGDAVARSLVSHRTTWQVPGRTDASTVLIDAGAPGTSAIVVRMRSRQPSSQMPPLGTVVRDQVAVDAVARWIATDLGVR